MKIYSITVTIQPHYAGYGYRELLIDVKTDRDKYRTTQTFAESDFECAFDRMLDRARREIIKLATKASKATDIKGID